MTIKPRDVVRATIRMQWTMEEFFASGGTTNFVDRLAGSLGVHASTIKVVSVYEGSVIVSFNIEPETESTSTIENVLEMKIVENELDLGAEIIDSTIGESIIDPTYWQY